jgi:hypothetical protein
LSPFCFGFALRPTISLLGPGELEWTILSRLLSNVGVVGRRTGRSFGGQSASLLPEVLVPV